MRAAGKEKALSLSPPFCYLSKTEGVTNLSECHLFSTIPLFLTQPLSTSCLGVITEDVEKWINVSVAPSLSGPRVTDSETSGRPS